MRESKIEKHLRIRIHRLGGVSIKMGKEGWPDRLVLLPRRLLSVFVELKAKNGKVKPHQERRHATLRALGQIVFVPKSIEDIDKVFPEAP